MIFLSDLTVGVLLKEIHRWKEQIVTNPSKGNIYL